MPSTCQRDEGHEKVWATFVCNDLHTFCDVTNFSSGVFEHRLKREADRRSKGWASLISSEFTDRPHPLVLNYTKKLNKKKKSHLRCRCLLILWKQQSSEPLNRWQRHPQTTRTDKDNKQHSAADGRFYLAAVEGGWWWWWGGTSCTG